MKSNNQPGFFSSIKTKLSLSMALNCIIPLTIAVSISFISATSVSTNDASKLNMKQAEYVENSFISTINANYRAMEQVASAKSTREFIAKPKDEVLFNAMVAQLQSVDANFADDNSTVITGTDGENLARSKGDFTNISDREYFKQAVSGNTYLSEVSISKTTGAKIVVPAVPIYGDDGKSVIGIITRNYNVDYLHNSLIESALDGQKLYIIDKEGNLVAASEEIAEGTEIDLKGTKVFSQVSSGNTEGSVNDTIEGTTYVTSYVNEPATGWTVIVATTNSSIMADAIHSAIIIIIIGIILTIIAITISILFGRSIAGPIKSIDHSLELLANGEFKDIKKYNGRKDEFGTIIRNTNSVIDKLRSIVNSIRGTASELEDDSTEIANSTSSISTTMDSIANTIQEIAEGAVHQAEEIQEASASIQIISDNIEGVTIDAGSLADTADSMHDDSQSSQRELNVLKQSSAQMAKAIERITNVISATNDAVDTISTKVAAIDSIASQTSLLALNASIEAARAGEAGRGFAVVAEEIGTLATDSANSASEIKDEMTKLLSQAQEAVQVAADVSQTNKYQHETIGNTVGSIQNLINGIQSTVGGVGRINSNTATCNSSKTVVVDAMTNISAISEENAANTETTSASIQEMNATVSILAQEAATMKEHADALIEEMSFFKS